MSAPDSIIIELLSRIQKCEGEIVRLNQEVEELKKVHVVITKENSKETTDDVEDETEENNEGFLTRGPARALVIERMQKLKPDAIIRPANRSEGSGIYFKDSKGVKLFKYYHSRSYEQSEVISWSGCQKSDIDGNYDAYIFSIWSEDNLYILIFTHKQMKDLIQSASKLTDSQGKYHFSFTIKPDLKVYEVRGPQYVDVSYSLNNYSIIN